MAISLEEIMQRRLKDYLQSSGTISGYAEDFENQMVSEPEVDEMVRDTAVPAYSLKRLQDLRESARKIIDISYLLPVDEDSTIESAIEALNSICSNFAKCIPSSSGQPLIPSDGQKTGENYKHLPPRHKRQKKQNVAIVGMKVV
ncbi:hypothetical protein R5R35_004998 [Gryllus longicercus]|uniref:Uncharacterized protein n=1 Tax=Gryllus longicercus TaxID=2509291 RepID=A0AAN9Z214_9ORTH